MTAATAVAIIALHSELRRAISYAHSLAMATTSEHRRPIGSSRRARARSRFRLAIRPTDRPPRPRAERLLRDRAAQHHRRASARTRARRASSSPAARRACTPRARRSAIPKIFELGIPVLGICYGMQLMCQALGGKVDSAPAREYGRAECDDRRSRRASVRRRAATRRKSG